VRVARAVAASATSTVRATRQVVTALQPVQTRAPTRASIEEAAAALLNLHGTLEQDLERVRATRPLVTASTKDRYLEAASSASATAERAGQGLKLAAGLYGPPGTARWFLAFQNPAELRGTGGLIGEYGIVESSPTGPKLVKVDHYSDLNERANEGVPLSGALAARYERYAIGQDWSAVNIPPDMPTVGRLITELYRRTTGDRIDGVIAADPLAVAQILRVTGPIQAGGSGWTPTTSPRRPWSRPMSATRRTTTPAAGSWRSWPGRASRPSAVAWPASRSSSSATWARPPAAATCRSSLTRHYESPIASRRHGASPSP
jgi:hypothetical protein